jgi:branched-subunit amino acid permease
MLTRRSLLTLAVFTLICFVITEAVGNHHHGFRQLVGDVTWFGFLLGLLFLIVVSVFILARVRQRSRSSAQTDA